MTKNVRGMDRNTFSDLVNGLWKGTGRRDYPDKTTLQVWYLGLGDLTEEEFAKAIMLYLRQHSKEFLSIELLRELSGVQQSEEVAALEAWNMAIEAIRICGGYRSPVFDDPVVSHVLQSLGGWVWFCDQESEELRTWVRQRFLQAYSSLAKVVKYPEPLKNLIQQSGGHSESVRIAARPRNALHVEAEVMTSGALSAGR